ARKLLFSPRLGFGPGVKSIEEEGNRKNLKRKNNAPRAFVAFHRRGRVWIACSAVAVLALSGLAWTVWAGTSKPSRSDSGTRQMAAILVQRAAAVDPLQLEFAVNDRRAEAFARELQRPQAALKRLSLQFAYAAELLNAGN